MTGFAALPIAEDGGEQDESHLAGEAKILGPKWLQLPALTVGLLGVQVLWSVEMSYGQPYLISLGLSKSAVSIVFLAGPISGLIVQPLIGVLADNSKSRFGRRRPYMLGASLICVIAMLLLGFTRPFASLFTSRESAANGVLTVALAIFALWIVDFSINAVQAVDRALLVDTLPTSKQADGNAWAARMLGIGSVAGYFIGNVDMTKILPFLGSTELEVLSILGSLGLLVWHGVTAFCVKERVVVASRNGGKSFIQEIKEIYTNARTLPSVIRQICYIQFFAWIGWFPVLFNTTEFIAELHKRSVGSDTTLTPEEILEEGARLGSRAMLFNAVLSLAANVILPLFVSEAGSRRHLESALGSGTGRPWWIRLYERMKIHLGTLWAVSHLLFAICMGATFFYSSVAGATFFTTLVGFSWSITQWAPFSLLAEAILSEDSAEETSSIRLSDSRTGHQSTDNEERQFLVGDSDEDDYEEIRSVSSAASLDDEGQQNRGGLGLMSNESARQSHLDVRPEDERAKPKRGGGLAAKAGIILGIHNIFIVLPQFIISGLSSVIFLFADAKPSPSTDPTPRLNATIPIGNLTTASLNELYSREGGASGAGPTSYAIVFCVGGVSALVALALTIKLLRELRQRSS
ncbi:MFS general substrate transporter [Cristinia sonorae]|uniref:MFS general substrate transporter n=1 Tax=Cristinia sonorae TaxID=1940300 RepID=A0A8K0XRJ2_9AGAR|nr:MFS general substrate transporter [Cristinia sonorae]